MMMYHLSSIVRWPWKQKLHYNRHPHTTHKIINCKCIVIENLIRSQIPILIKCILDRFPQSGSLGPRGGYSTDASDQIARYAPLIISLLCSLEWNTGELLGLFSPSSYRSYRWLFSFSSFCVRLCVWVRLYSIFGPHVLVEPVSCSVRMKLFPNCFSSPPPRPAPQALSQKAITHHTHYYQDFHLSRETWLKVLQQFSLLFSHNENQNNCLIRKSTNVQ